MAKWSNYYTAAEILLSKSSHWLCVCNSHWVMEGKSMLAWGICAGKSTKQVPQHATDELSRHPQESSTDDFLSYPPSPSTWWLPNTSPCIFPCVRAAGAIAEPLTKQQPASLTADSCKGPWEQGLLSTVTFSLKKGCCHSPVLVGWCLLVLLCPAGYPRLKVGESQDPALWGEQLYTDKWK